MIFLYCIHVICYWIEFKIMSQMPNQVSKYLRNLVVGILDESPHFLLAPLDGVNFLFKQKRE